MCSGTKDDAGSIFAKYIGKDAMCSVGVTDAIRESVISAAPSYIAHLHDCICMFKIESVARTDFSIPNAFKWRKISSSK